MGVSLIESNNRPSLYYTTTYDTASSGVTHVSGVTMCKTTMQHTLKRYNDFTT